MLSKFDNVPFLPTLYFQLIILIPARILTKTPRRDYISEVLVSLHWLRIEQRIVYKTLILTYKAFVDHSAPVYLSELLNKKCISANTRSANDDFFIINPSN